MIREDRLRADLADAARLSRPVDLYDRVVRADRRSRATIVVCAAAVLTLMAAGVGVAVWRRSGGPILPAGPLRAVTLPEGDVARRPWMGAQVVRDRRAFSDGTLTVPAWPRVPECPSGELGFRLGGRVVDSPGMEIQVIKSLWADVDRDGSDDLLVHLGCNSTWYLSPEDAIVAQVVAYSGGRVLGRVVASPPHRNAPFIHSGDQAVHITDVSVDAAGRVRVDWMDLSSGTPRTSTRTFGWDGNGFAEVGEPTDLQGPTGAELAIEARGTAGVDRLARRYLTVDVTVRNSGSTPSSPVRLGMVVPAYLRPAGGGWAGCVRPTETQMIMNMTPSPVDQGASLAVVCPGSAVAPGQAVPRRFEFLDGDRAGSSLTTISIEVDQQPPGEYERELGDNSVQVALP